MSYQTAPHWAKYCAWDEDGTGGFYEQKPVANYNLEEWVAVEGAFKYCSNPAPKCNWDKSLTEVNDDLL